jgi:hypothetical protein
MRNVSVVDPYSEAEGKDTGRGALGKFMKAGANFQAKGRE